MVGRSGSEQGHNETPERRVTQPDRRFELSHLQELDREHRRKLVQLLLTEGGVAAGRVSRPGGVQAFVLRVTPLWRERTIRARLATAEVEQSDIDRLTERLGETGDAEGIVLAPFGVAEGVNASPSVSIVDGSELIHRLERSALVAWPERRPVPSYERVSEQRILEEEAALLDPVGLRWLPTAAVNELPTELAASGLAPQDLLERLAFRMFTAVFRFGGSATGEAARGERVPDAPSHVAGIKRR